MNFSQGVSVMNMKRRDSITKIEDQIQKDAMLEAQNPFVREKKDGTDDKSIFQEAKEMVIYIVVSAIDFIYMYDDVPSFIVIFFQNIFLIFPSPSNLVIFVISLFHNNI
jgi:hypothetical protein